MERLLVVTSTPHIKDGTTTRRIMLDVLIALTPALIVSVLYFGPRALLCVAASVCSCMFFEWGSQKLFKRKCTVGDLSAVVTGVLLAFNLPVTTPLWIFPIGAFFAIAVTKQLFGGIGQNFANPAITARIVIMLSFAGLISKYPLPFAWLNPSADGITGATPLSAETIPSFKELLLGLHGGALGEVCVLALIAGGIYLCIRRVISPLVPVIFMGSTVLFCWLFGADPLTSLLTGGLVLGAVFMATDYATTPVTVLGRIIFAIGCGFLTALIRCFGTYPEGVSFAILLMNICTPIIDRFTRPKPFGGESK
ncbi:MAG: RnfABCDGE type electron transport complex subunit D [Clostridia bacterium]|nr:RnfABCDGE type electron transport complex subunit D [Clostridia bacterium]